MCLSNPIHHGRVVVDCASPGVCEVSPWSAPSATAHQAAVITPIIACGAAAVVVARTGVQAAQISIAATRGAMVRLLVAVTRVAHCRSPWAAQAMCTFLPFLTAWLALGRGLASVSISRALLLCVLAQ